ncbi:MAG TPA: PLP-dependent aminotransferase family protein [Patescibacteria group bacterium]|nr:PLP-dependent aminotransferase family protein [Patescibacteria group bacterium]
MDISKFLSATQLDSSLPTPIYLQIAGLIEEKILDASLSAGAKLPPERELAALLSVSRTTAINAYRQLEQKEMVRTRVGSGTYVADLVSSANLPAIAWSQLFVPRAQTPLSSLLRELVSATISDESISLAAGMPDPAFYPIHDFNRLFNAHAPHSSAADFGHIATEGYSPFRESLAAHLRSRGIPATAKNTLILTGSKQGMYLLTKIFIEPGDYVIVESPTYLGAIQAFQLAGARLLTLPVNPALSLATLEDYLVRYRPKLYYALPTFQNPNGHVLPLQMRKDLLQLAARHRLVILEDDPYSELYFDQAPPPSLKELDHYGGVLSLGSFSKILFPGLRTGWLVAPEAVINRVAMEKQHVDLHSNSMTQWLLHHYLCENLLDDHLRLVRREYKKRRAAAMQALRRFCGDAIEFSQPDGGLYLWCRIRAQVTARQLLHETTKVGVSFVPGEAFYADAQGTREFRLCFATHNEAQLTEGIKRLGKALHLLSRSVGIETLPSTQVGRPII